MAKLSFAIALNLITDGFKRGTNQVKSGMASIKSAAMSTAAYFGAGFLGIAEVFNKIKTAGLQTAKAINVLKANSGGLAQFGTNLSYVRGIASKYRLELSGLITEYSKFTAAATTAGFSIKQQQTIFEGVQRAIKGYKLSEEDSATVMASLQKMMNTGTISTRNFTNSFLRAMPQAKQALADAMGVSVDKIGALVKKGIDAKGVMENFAKSLRLKAPAIDTSDLGSANNRISNAFSGIAEDSHVTAWIAKITNKVADLIEYIHNNAQSLAYTIAGLMAGIKISQFFAQWRTFSKASSDAIVMNAHVAHSKLNTLMGQHSRLKAQVTAQEEKLAKASADERLALEVELNAKKRALAANELATAKAKDTAIVADERASAVMSGNAWSATKAKFMTGMASVGASLKSLWSTAGPMIVITIITELISKFMEIRGQIAQVKKSWEDYKNGAKMAVHTQEIEQLQTLQGLYNKAKGSTKEQRIYQDQINSLLGTQFTKENQINNAIAKRISLLEATAKVNYYVNKKLEAQDKQNQILSKYGGSEKTLNKKAGVAAAVQTGATIGGVKGWGMALGMAAGNFTSLWGSSKALLDASAYREAAAEIRDASNNINNATKYLAKNGGLQAANYGNPGSGTDGGGQGRTVKSTGRGSANTSGSELSRIESQYAQSLRELESQKKLGIISDEQYRQNVNDLSLQTLVQVKSSKDTSVKNSDFSNILEKNTVRMSDADKQLIEIQRDYSQKLGVLVQQKNLSLIDDKEYQDKMQGLIYDTAMAASSISGISTAGKEYVKQLMTRAQQDSAPIKLESRDTTFDYKKTKEDILGEDLEITQKNLDILKEKVIKTADDMQRIITLEMQKTDLSKALKLERLRKDVEDFTKVLRSQTWGSIKSIMSGSDQIVSSWEQLGKTLNDADATGWEKIMSIWSTLENSVEGIISIIDAVNSWTQASDDLKNAKRKEAAVVNATNMEEVASNIIATGAQKALGSAAESSANTTTSSKTDEAITVVTANVLEGTSELASAETVQSASSTKASANARDVAGNTSAAASAVGKSAAESLPFPFNIIAVAAAITSVLALMSQLPKFAKGGIVGGGGTSGDNMLARVNSGEMILNGSQQKRLFNAINGGLLDSNRISFDGGVVRGADIYLSLKNYLKKTGNKL